MSPRFEQFISKNNTYRTSPQLPLTGIATHPSTCNVATQRTARVNVTAGERKRSHAPRTFD